MSQPDQIIAALQNSQNPDGINFLTQLIQSQRPVAVNSFFAILQQGASGNAVAAAVSLQALVLLSRSLTPSFGCNVDQLSQIWDSFGPACSAYRNVLVGYMMHTNIQFVHNAAVCLSRLLRLEIKIHSDEYISMFEQIISQNAGHSYGILYCFLIFLRDFQHVSHLNNKFLLFIYSTAFAFIGFNAPPSYLNVDVKCITLMFKGPKIQRWINAEQQQQLLSVLITKMQELSTAEGNENEELKISIYALFRHSFQGLWEVIHGCIAALFELTSADLQSGNSSYIIAAIKFWQKAIKTETRKLLSGQINGQLETLITPALIGNLDKFVLQLCSNIIGNDDELDYDISNSALRFLVSLSKLILGMNSVIKGPDGAGYGEFVQEKTQSFLQSCMEFHQGMIHNPDWKNVYAAVVALNPLIYLSNDQTAPVVFQALKVLMDNLSSLPPPAVEQVILLLGKIIKHNPQIAYDEGNQQYFFQFYSACLQSNTAIASSACKSIISLTKPFNRNNSLPQFFNMLINVVWLQFNRPDFIDDSHTLCELAPSAIRNLFTHSEGICDTAIAFLQQVFTRIQESMQPGSPFANPDYLSRLLDLIHILLCLPSDGDPPPQIAAFVTNSIQTLIALLQADDSIFGDIVDSIGLLIIFGKGLALPFLQALIGICQNGLASENSQWIQGAVLCLSDVFRHIPQAGEFFVPVIEAIFTCSAHCDNLIKLSCIATALSDIIVSAPPNIGFPYCDRLISIQRTFIDTPRENENMHHKVAQNNETSICESMIYVASAIIHVYCVEPNSLRNKALADIIFGFKPLLQRQKQGSFNLLQSLFTLIKRVKNTTQFVYVQNAPPPSRVINSRMNNNSITGYLRLAAKNPKLPIVDKHRINKALSEIRQF